MRKTVLKINRHRVIYEFTLEDILKAIEDRNNVILQPEDSGVVRVTRNLLVSQENPVLVITMDYDETLNPQDPAKAEGTPA